MSTPHVSGVAALVWSQNASWTNVQIRAALRSSAMDLGLAGPDTAYGYGLVQGLAALCSLDPGHAACGGGTPNVPPSASFTYACAGLSCNFTDTSTDVDGTVSAWTWSFGDGGTSASQHPTHSYGVAGSYGVRLTVADDRGATGSTSQTVTVSGVPSAITLTVSGSKVKGVKRADLSWTGATSSNVDIYRDASRIATVLNSGTYQDVIGKGGGTHTYQVCEAGTSVCSSQVSVAF
jgi:PKD repeat protein